MKRSILMLSLVALVACGDFSTTIRPTAVTLSADRSTATTGQNFQISYSAQGRSLNRLVIDYGDGAQDSLGFGGAVTATGSRNHAYESPGTYIVTGTLEELQGTAVESTVTLSVTSTP